MTINLFNLNYIYNRLPTPPLDIQIRSTLSDFAVLIAIVCCTIIDYIMDLDTPKLMVPEEFKV